MTFIFNPHRCAMYMGNLNDIDFLVTKKHPHQRDPLMFELRTNTLIITFIWICHGPKSYYSYKRESLAKQTIVRRRRKKRKTRPGINRYSIIIHLYALSSLTWKYYFHKMFSFVLLYTLWELTIHSKCSAYTPHTQQWLIRINQACISTYSHFFVEKLLFFF